MSDAPTNSVLKLPILAVDHERTSVVSPHLEHVTTLFEHFRNPLLRYLLALGMLIHDGEEIIQEVFLALFQHLQQGKPRTNLRGWTFRVAHNLALKRRQAIRQKAEVAFEPELGNIKEHLDPTPNPEEQLASRQRQQHLRSVLRAMPEQDQYCLYLRAEGLRYREIAEILSMSLGAVSNSLTRSLARLERADSRFERVDKG